MKNVRLDCTVFSVDRVEDLEEIDRTFWLSKSPTERLEAIELSRSLLYGKESTRARLRRVLEITRRS